MSIKWTPKKIIVIAISVVALLFVVWSAGSICEVVDADEIVVIQYPTGTLKVHTTAGIKMQWWGKVTKYKKSDQLWFSDDKDEGGSKDTSVGVRFNDGANANVSGSVRFDLPTSEEPMKELHRKYGSHAAVKKDLVWTVVTKAVYMTGPLMSSKESYAERRPDLISFIGDQISYGVYRTEIEKEKIKDPLTGEERVIEKAVIMKDDGKALRQEASPLSEFGLRTYNLKISSVKYDDEVEEQIRQQQRATMEVQIAIKEAKKADQRAITAEKEGQAEAAKAKWEQEVVKAKAVTEAQQKKEVATLAAEERRDVAKLDKEAAEFWKQEQILKGEGEAKRKKLVMQADGALDKKLAAWKEVNAKYAEQLGKQRWVPNVVVGGSTAKTGGSYGSAATILDLFMIKTAKEIGLDTSISTK